MLTRASISMVNLPVSPKQSDIHQGKYEAGLGCFVEKNGAVEHDKLRGCGSHSQLW